MLDFSARVADRDFEAALTVGTGETVAILGPNGAGKSTLLNVIAGLVRPDSGHALLRGNTLFQLQPGARGVWLPPYSRGVSLLAQQALLFPHLSALENVAFGPQSAGAGKRAARALAVRWLREVDAEEFAERKPSQLSGGQAQRVAVARALAANPRLLLLDEPMSALDVTVTPALRRMLRRVLADQTVIIVTHDVLDAFTLADRVAVMKDGRIHEEGPTREVFERPKSPFTAALVGLNFISGIRTSSGLAGAEGIRLTADGPAGLATGSPAAATLAPDSIRLSIERPSDSALNVVNGIVSDLEPRGDRVRVHVGALFADVAPATVADLDIAPGMSLWAGFAAGDTVLYAL